MSLWLEMEWCIIWTCTCTLGILAAYKYSDHIFCDELCVLRQSSF